MNRIKILNKNLINKLSAGELIRDPSYVLKELVENAIDAGSNNIKINIKNGGKQLIEVIDNGCGINKDDLKLVFTKNATSKITSVKDIHHIKTLGFRGEALSAIGSISNYSLISNPYNETYKGYGISNTFGNIDRFPFPHLKGTTVSISDLFYNNLIKLKYLSSDRIENNKIFEMFYQLVLSRFDICWTLINKNNIYKLLPCVNIDECINRICKIFGKNLIKNSLFINKYDTKNKIKIMGWLFIPTDMVNKKKQYIFINRRIIKDPLLKKIILKAYNEIMFKGLKPSYILYISINSKFLDVNIHPNKYKVRFIDENIINTFIFEKIYFALKHNCNLQNKQRFNKKEENYSLSASKQICNKNFLGFAICQYKEKYIISQNQEGLIIVDIHAAHERIIYEKIKNQQLQKKIVRQKLLLPISLKVDYEIITLIKKYQDNFFNIGITLEIIKFNVILIKEIPKLFFKNINIYFLLKKLFEKLQLLHSEKTIKNIFKKSLIKYSCYNSIRSNKKLTIIEMNSLLREMELTKHIKVCNHGRPTWIKLSNNKLDKLFLRKI
ncbi:DNA mismatch repair protein MutL [Candidatus Portiera aleyrodidarum]|uniref:DNA mismatch repair protein MutL n=1 Tax=Candidatus Portiera aleyrodidarum TV TaxID=1297582 RepID=A0A8D3X8L9_9GAMM|nr:DNA mismatch repair endonuclease MutL [Candidatus Portiera aleyrodidarum]AGI27171.1 DNA mismatch repair protein mutL [Candidatus Portiera aleyrodidarum TV]CEI59149.1 DNA mismatch repair protein MutL [Candidatus Portiera aleyrodidarum]